MRYKYIILGAGCAGLSLCWYLLEAGVCDPILILDRRTCFGNDRTWCFWDTEPNPFTPLATHRWPTWEVRRSHDGPGIRASAPATPYVRLRAEDFYQAALARIRAHDNVTLKLGVAVTGGYHENGSGGVCIATSAGVFEGEMLFDALSVGSPRFPVAQTGDVTFLQQFFGQFIQTDSDVFDPQTVTLMDFAVAGTKDEREGEGEAIRFMYLLPLSPREALVENTVLLPGGSGAKDAPARVGSTAANRRDISAYLKMRYDIDTFQVSGEEQGLIPMTTRHFPVQTGKHTFSIGLVGGAARPSSGYAFQRIQRNCRNLAQALIQGNLGLLRQTAAQRRTATLDRIFLRTMQQNPGAVPGYFDRLFSRVPPDKLVRLLSDSASLLDCAAVVRALPPADFIRAAASGMQLPRTLTDKKIRWPFPDSP